MSSKTEQSESTRHALVAAARQLFAEHGFTHTPTEAVVALAGVTRGALYHHFADKTELFAAVYEDLEQTLVEDLAARMEPGASPLALLHLGIEVFLDACLDPAVRRVTLLEGPTVLGWRRWHDIQELYGLGLTRRVLQAAMEAGELRPFSVDPLAHLLLGALVESAMVLALADDTAVARGEMAEALHGVVDALRP